MPCLAHLEYLVGESRIHPWLCLRRWSMSALCDGCCLVCLLYLEFSHYHAPQGLQRGPWHWDRRTTFYCVVVCRYVLIDTSECQSDVDNHAIDNNLSISQWSMIIVEMMLIIWHFPCECFMLMTMMLLIAWYFPMLLMFPMMGQVFIISLNFPSSLLVSPVSRAMSSWLSTLGISPMHLLRSCSWLMVSHRVIIHFFSFIIILLKHETYH